MTTRTPRYEVVIDGIGIPCATLQEAREYAAEDTSGTARIYRRTRNGWEEVS